MAQKALFHKLTFCVGGTLFIAIVILGHASMDKTVFSENVISQKFKALKSHLSEYYWNSSKGKVLFQSNKYLRVDFVVSVTVQFEGNLRNRS